MYNFLDQKGWMEIFKRYGVYINKIVLKDEKEPMNTVEGPQFDAFERLVDRIPRLTKKI